MGVHHVIINCYGANISISDVGTIENVPMFMLFTMLGTDNTSFWGSYFNCRILL